MKKIITLTVVLAASLVFTGCGGGSSSGSTAGTSPAGGQQQAASSKVVPLHIGEVTAIKPGYSIVDSNDEAVLDILVTGETRTVTLKSGAASIKMPI